VFVATHGPKIDVPINKTVAFPDGAALTRQGAPL